MESFLKVLSYPTFILLGVYWTVLISIIAIAGGSVIGVITAFMKMSRSRILRSIAIVYIDFFRTTPLLIQLIWAYFALPMLVGMEMSSLQCAAMVMSLYAGAYISEIVRSGILAVPRGQSEAAKAIGMNSFQVMFRVVLPQGVVKMLPTLGSTFITMIKDSSLCSAVGLPELVRQANALGAFTLNRPVAILLSGVLYFIITYSLSVVVNKYHKKYI